MALTRVVSMERWGLKSTLEWVERKVVWIEEEERGSVSNLLGEQRDGVVVKGEV